MLILFSLPVNWILKYLYQTTCSYWCCYELVLLIVIIWLTHASVTELYILCSVACQYYWITIFTRFCHLGKNRSNIEFSCQNLSLINRIAIIICSICAVSLNCVTSLIYRSNHYVQCFCMVCQWPNTWFPAGLYRKCAS